MGIAKLTGPEGGRRWGVVVALLIAAVGVAAARVSLLPTHGAAASLQVELAVLWALGVVSIGAIAYLVRLRARLRAMLRLIETSPFAVVLYDGPDHRPLLSNPKHEEMTGGRLVLGAPLGESLPELVGHPAVRKLDEVYRSGVQETLPGVSVKLPRGGAMRDCWFDVTWQPVHDVKGVITGVLVSSVEVTEHVLTQQRLEAARAAAETSKQVNEVITANATRGLIMLDARRQCTFLNPAAAKLLGYTLSELQELQRPVHEIVHHHRRDGTPYAVEECPIERAVAQGASASGEEWFVRRDGSFYPVFFAVSPISDSAIGMGSIIELTDITEQKSTEEELQRIKARLESKQGRLRLVIEYAPQAVAMFDREMRYLLASRRWRHGNGLGDADLTGVSHYDAPPDLPEHWRQVHQRCLNGAVEHSDGESFPRANGTVQWVRWEARPWHEPNGAVGGIIIFVEDITAQKQTELALRESERQFRELVDNLPELAWSAEPDGHITFYNRRWYEYTGSTFEEMQGWGWRSVHDPAHVDRTAEEWLAAIAQGAPVEMEFQLRGADGIFRWFLTRVQPLRNSAGAIVRWIGTNTNIDELRRMRAERERVVAELQRTLDMRDEFISIASHELRTPLTALQLQIQAASNLVRRGAADGANAKLLSRLDKADRQTQRLGELVNGLLDVSRIELGKLELVREEVDLYHLVAEVVERHELPAQTAGCAVRLERSAPIVGHWDRLRIEQVATNVLSNAIKYGAGRPIEVRVTTDGDTAAFVVQDQGMGIAANDLTRIFGRFERAVPSTHFGGLGLGLYISKQIVEAHGGCVDVASEVGVGATFRVALPLRGPTS